MMNTNSFYNRAFYYNDKILMGCCIVLNYLADKHAQQAYTLIFDDGELHEQNF